MVFPVFPQENGAFAHHLEERPLPYNLIFPSVPVPFLRADKELGCSRQVVDIFKDKILKFTCVIFQVQSGGTYSLGLYEPPGAIGVCINSLF